MGGYGKVDINGYLQSSQVQKEGFFSLDKFAKDGDNNYYEYYNLTPDENGIFQPDYNALKPELIEKFEEYYNSDEFRLETLNGVQVINTSEFRSLIQNEIIGFENAIEVWNSGVANSLSESVIRASGGLPSTECIFNYYDELNGINIPVDLATLKSFNSILMNKIRLLFHKHKELINDLNNSTDDSYISNWLESSKTELDNYKASL
jgi:hypothetical protein